MKKLIENFKKEMEKESKETLKEFLNSDCKIIPNYNWLLEQVAISLTTWNAKEKQTAIDIYVKLALDIPVKKTPYKHNIKNYAVQLFANNLLYDIVDKSYYKKETKNKSYSKKAIAYYTFKNRVENKSTKEILDTLDDAKNVIEREMLGIKKEDIFGMIQMIPKEVVVKIFN